ncbi:MAG: hypothetical protein QM698_07190 [Micropepsaceae bacterium]
MNSSAHHPGDNRPIEIGSTEPARGQTNLIACQYDGVVVHYLIMSNMQLTDLLADQGERLGLFRMLQTARRDLTLTDVQRFDYVIQFGQAEARAERAARDAAYALAHDRLAAEG